MRTKRSDHETMLAFRVPKELHERLKRAADDAGRGLAAELRQRLEASLGPPAPSGADAETTDLLEAVAGVARQIDADFGTWHADPGAYAVFSRALNLVLRWYKPEGEQPEKLTPKPGSWADLVSSQMDLDMAVSVVSAAPGAKRRKST